MRARTITDELALAAAHEWARAAEGRGLNDDRTLPSKDDWEVVSLVAVATATRAQEQKVARRATTVGPLHREAAEIIQRAREMARILQTEWIVPPVPENGVIEGEDKRVMQT